ncbi:MAG: hypothetical protein K8M05_07875 [Deltaproteobacteria bacterium]|nr:hypothetical protein [Kofleriaceae bacterium]
MRYLALLGLVVLAACGGPKDRTGAALELADARLVVTQADGQTRTLALAAGGAVTFDNQPVVTLEKNGHIVIAGKRLARVERDGSISANTVRTNVVVKEDGTFVLDGVEELTIGPDGKVTGPLFETMDHPRVQLEGGTMAYQGPPAARRATMVGFAAFVTSLPTAVAP